MLARDPDEPHRPASSLELLFDRVRRRRVAGLRRVAPAVGRAALRRGAGRLSESATGDAGRRLPGHRHRIRHHAGGDALAVDARRDQRPRAPWRLRALRGGHCGRAGAVGDLVADPRSGVAVPHPGAGGPVGLADRRALWLVHVDRAWRIDSRGDQFDHREHARRRRADRADPDRAVLAGDRGGDVVDLLRPSATRPDDHAAAHISGAICTTSSSRRRRRTRPGWKSRSRCDCTRAT